MDEIPNLTDAEFGGCGMTLEQIEALGQGFTYAQTAEPYLPRAGDVSRIVWAPESIEACIGQLVLVRHAAPAVFEGRPCVAITGAIRWSSGNKDTECSRMVCRVEPVEKDSTSDEVNVGSERGDSGTGEAAGYPKGESSAAAGEPAASSGFQPPQTVEDVECPTCGGKSAREFPSSSKTWCRDSERRQLHDGNGNAGYHQLRIDRFEATRETDRKPDARLNATCVLCGCETWRGSKHCADCRRDDERLDERSASIDQRIAAARAKLRSDLDRPLPRALVTWPEAWSSSSSESDH